MKNDKKSIAKNVKSFYVHNVFLVAPTLFIGLVNAWWMDFNK